MKRLSNIRNILLLCATVLLGSCDLTETMQVEADKAMVFGSESGLRLYAYSFYRALPTLSTGYQQDEMCDIAAVRQTNVFIQQNAYNSETATNWSWGTSTILLMVVIRKSARWMRLPVIIIWASPVGSVPGSIMIS